MKRLLLAALFVASMSAAASAAGPYVPYSYPSSLARLTSASPTTCTSIAAFDVGGRLASITNVGAAQTATITIYDEGASPTCAAADILYGPQAIGLGQVITFALSPLSNGLAYSLSAPLTGSLLIGWN